MARDTSPTNKPAPVVIDTQKLTGAVQDPRGDNRPGVIPDQPAEEGINPVTNLPDELTAEDGVTARIPDQSADPVNPPILETAKDSKPKGRMVEMTADRDYWPRVKPDDMDPDAEYRVRAGESFSVPQSEAEDLMERGIAKRVKRS